MRVFFESGEKRYEGCGDRKIKERYNEGGREGGEKNVRNCSIRMKERVTRKFRREISQHERDVSAICRERKRRRLRQERRGNEECGDI